MDGNATTLPAHSGAIVTMVTSHWPMAATSVVLGLATWLLQIYFRKDELESIPTLGTGSKVDRRNQFLAPGGAWDLHKEGYKKFKDGIYRLVTLRERETVIVSAKFLPELKNLPDDTLSFVESVAETLQSKYTKMNNDANALAHTVRASLTPALPRINHIVFEEVVAAMRDELPQSSDWTEVKINDKFLRIIAIAAGRAFVGPELCHDENYLDAAINYTVDLMHAVHAVSFVPAWKRPWKAPRLPQIKKLQQRTEEAVSYLQPVVESRIKAAEEPGYERPDDMLQWLIDAQSKYGKRDIETLARMQLSLTFASIHTTSVALLNTVYTLVSMPEMVPMLREDVEQALAISGGKYTSVSMQHMKKLDSFLKEVMRYYPFSASSFQRKVLKPFVLSSGQAIPAGINIEVPSWQVHNDPELFPEPDKFDALRFYKLREAKHSSDEAAASVVAKSQFVGVSTEHLTFGYGRHACPGRFFAANEIKMILGVALLQYEMKMPDGVEGRYANVRMGQGENPDTSKTIMVRVRQ